MRAILDSPSNNFLGVNTIDIKMNMAFNYVNAAITISNFAEVNVRDAVMQFGAWQLYMVYIESISEYIKAQTPRIVENRLATLKESADLFLKLIGVSLDQDDDIALSKPRVAVTMTTTRSLCNQQYLDPCNCCNSNSGCNTD